MASERGFLAGPVHGRSREITGVADTVAVISNKQQPRVQVGRELQPLVHQCHCALSGLHSCARNHEAHAATERQNSYAS
jgi:hypothetical protein